MLKESNGSPRMWCGIRKSSMFLILLTDLCTCVRRSTVSRQVHFFGAAHLPRQLLDVAPRTRFRAPCHVCFLQCFAAWYLILGFAVSNLVGVRLPEPSPCFHSVAAGCSVVAFAVVCVWESACTCARTWVRVWMGGGVFGQIYAGNLLVVPPTT